MPRLFRSIAVFGLASLLAIWFAACERTLKVGIDGQLPPTFSFRGSGELSWVYIYEVTPEGKIPPKGSSFWVIVPSGVIKARSAPSIKYGVVPPGFVQTVPAAGKPPPLQEGKTYGFGAVTREAPSGCIWFKVQNGRPIQVAKTDPAAEDVPSL